MRPLKNEYYLGIAEQVSKRGTCLRRNYGAVIVKDNRIISTGYVGAPTRRENCSDMGHCVRQTYNIPSGQRYELCRSVHAEANAIIQANPWDMEGSTLYLYGYEVATGEPVVNAEPCAMCKRLIINAGIKRVITPQNIFDVDKWIENDDSKFCSDTYGK